MKVKILLFPVLLFFLSSSSCDDPEIPDNNLSATDTTTYLKTIQETGGYRTFYKPQNGFVGDPMPFYNSTDNTFYLFFLQDWRNGSPTDHPIYFTKTTNFGSFQTFTEAIPCGSADSQEQFLGTGSFFKDANGKLYGYYTGHNGNLFPAEKIMLATSTDMRTFTKIPSFTFEAPTGFDKNNFRDPFVYNDPVISKYVMVITSVKNGKGVLIRYSSIDLINWIYLDYISDFDSDAQILECPDIFKMGNKWYLVFSRINRDEHRKTFYRIADNPAGPWKKCTDINGTHETFDGLYFYAAKTTSNASSRYISGWCSTGQQVNGKNELDWGGNLITHEIVQQPNGKLYPRMPKELDNKFNKEIEYLMIKSKGNVIKNQNKYTITALDKRSYALFNRNNSPVKISMQVDASQSNKFGFSFGAGGDLSELYSVTFDLSSNNKWSTPIVSLIKENNYTTGYYTKELNFNPLIVPENKIFNIKIIIEKSVCIFYINDNVAFTNRIYKMDQNPWTIFADNGVINISELMIKKQ